MKSQGFTLLEIIVVVVILGILAGVAIPKLTAPNEAVISSEARQNLIALLGAQKRYQLENSPNYATDINNLDIAIQNNSNLFGAPSVANDANAVASLTRAGNLYTLTVTGTGVIKCSSAGDYCTRIKCNKGVGGDQCN